jgi:hypothetical protein
MSERQTYFVLSRASAYESDGLVLVDPQAIKRYVNEDEVAAAFNHLNLSDLAEQYQRQLRPEQRLVLVSKIVSICDEYGNTCPIARDDLRVVPSR